MDVQDKSAVYSLYLSQYCYFCQKVMMKLGSAEHSIKFLDVSDRANHIQLVSGGGKGQVPCLRIEKQGEAERWMYESDDILHYIQQQGLLA